MTTITDVLRCVRAKDESGLLRLLQVEKEAGCPVNLNETVEDTTALVEAILTGKTALVVSLLDAGADVDLGCVHAVSPLCVAAAVDNVSMARLLLQRRANIRHLVDGRPLCHVATPLHYAIQMKSYSMAEVLLEHGHDPNLPSHMYKYPLVEAIRLACTGIVRLLANNPRCIVDGRIDGYGCWNFPPLHQALFRYRRYEAAQALLDTERCSLSFQSASYLCVLLWRCRDTSYCHERMACMLLEAGADLEAKDHEGHTPIQSYISGNLVVELAETQSVLRLLVEAGVTPTRKEAALIEDHVRSDADREVAEWMTEVANAPRPLRDLTRRMLRRLMGLYPMSRLSRLQLPPLIRDFVTLQYLRDFHWKT